MQYIQTKFMPNSNKVKAKASFSNESLIIAYDHSVDVEQAHAKAAMQLAKKLDWNGEYAAGGNESGYVFAFIGNSNTYTTEV